MTSVAARRGAHTRRLGWCPEPRAPRASSSHPCTWGLGGLSGRARTDAQTHALGAARQQAAQAEAASPAHLLKGELGGEVAAACTEAGGGRWDALHERHSDFLGRGGSREEQEGE